MTGTGPTEGDAAPGRGAPAPEGHAGEEAAVDRYLQVPRTSETGQASTARAVFVVARRGSDPAETPAFGDGAGSLAVAVFTDRNRAFHYVQSAGWLDTHEPVALAPADLGPWLREVRAAGVGHALLNPNRQHHVRGEPQRTLPLDSRLDRSDEAFYDELAAVGTD